MDSTDQESGEEIRQVAWYSLLLNIALVAVKIWLSVLTGSLALWADGIHSLVDVFSAVALIIGQWLSQKKSTEFPYGLYKVENLVSAIISILIFLTAYEIVTTALSGAGIGIPVNGWVLLAVAALIPVPFLFGEYQIRIGKKFNSPSLIADGTQHRTDVLSSLVVFFAVAGQYVGFPLDRAAAVIVSLFIVHAGWRILVDSMKVLLDASIDAATRDLIWGIIHADPVVSSVAQVTGRNSGRYIFVEADVEVRIDDLARAHQVSERIEQRIREAVPNVDRVLIHYEPSRKQRIRYAVPVSEDGDSISLHFGEAPSFALIDINVATGRVVSTGALENRFVHVEKGKGIKVAEMLLARKIDVVVTREDLSGKGPGYAFQEAGVATITTDRESMRMLIGDLLEDKEKDSRTL